MLQFAQMQHLEQANKKDLELLREWLDRREGGDQFLQGREASTWSPEHTKDLVGIASRYNEKDWFSRWMGDRLIPWFHCRIGYKVKVYHETKMNFLTHHCRNEPQTTRKPGYGSTKTRRSPPSPTSLARSFHPSCRPSPSSSCTL